MPMIIGIMGWWRYDNQGDIKIRDNMTRALAPHRVVPIDLPFPFTEDSLQRLNLLDFLILGGGGLFKDIPPPPFDTFDAWGRQLETPIGVAGVGIDKILPEYRPLISALADQARFFYVRDPVSQQLVEHPNVQLVPDLSFLYPLNNAPNTRPLSHQPPVCGVNLRLVPGLEINRWIETLRGLPMRLRGIPFSTFDVWQETRILRQIDGDCAKSFDPGLYKDLDLMVGAAFHSVIFAIQAAIPVIAIAYAPKVERLMKDIGLQDYVLEPHEWHKLPKLVERVLVERRELIDYLHRTTTALTESGRIAIADIREEIERTTGRRVWSGPKVSIVVAGTRSDEANRSTLASCLDQTYEDVEVMFVGDEAHGHFGIAPSLAEVKLVPNDPTATLGERLNRAFAHATGEYLSWTLGGNLYARDAIACMAHRLQQEPACDMVYTEYYALHNEYLIADVFPVYSARKLFRRNVVGPCFLYRRKLAEGVGPFKTDTSLAAYDYWLRAQTIGNLQPMHVQLFYALLSNIRGEDRQVERRVRHQWRSTKSWPLQILWRIVDNDLVEDWVIRPLLVSVRRARAAFRHQGW